MIMMHSSLWGLTDNWFLDCHLMWIYWYLGVTSLTEYLKHNLFASAANVFKFVNNCFFIAQTVDATIFGLVTINLIKAHLRCHSSLWESDVFRSLSQRHIWGYWHPSQTKWLPFLRWLSRVGNMCKNFFCVGFMTSMIQD